MSRPESQALAGFYPAPLGVVELIASHFEHALLVEGYWPDYFVSVVDPCAGEGEAAASFLEIVTLGEPKRAVAYFCEMEEGRFAKAKRAFSRVAKSSRGLESDAFRVRFLREGGASFLFLNPPYDPDREHGRLEQRFLHRFASVLAPGGWLVFLVPFYALAASADFLSREFDRVECHRFPDGEFEAYKQVALVARKAYGLEPSARVRAEVEGWSRDPASFPVLERAATWSYELPKGEGGSHGGVGTWEAKAFDVEALLSKISPWSSSSSPSAKRVVDGRVVPGLPLAELMLRRYPMATPPRPAHVAAGIAAGVFNGSRVEPPLGSSLPPLLVKGVFDREYRPVDQKRGKRGEVVGVVEVQQPKLVVSVFDLRERRYHVLKSTSEETGASKVEDFGVADLLKHYGAGLLEVMNEHCPILYDARRDASSIPLAKTERVLFAAQAHAARALVKLLGGPSLAPAKRWGRCAILAGEIGSGKSTVALAAAATCGARRLLVMCPPHLIDSWRNEARAVFPGAGYRVLEGVADVDRLAAYRGEELVVAVLSREAAKLSHSWSDAGRSCPRCGEPFPEEMLRERGLAAKKRARCEAKSVRPRGDVARAAAALAVFLSFYDPDAPVVRGLLRGRFSSERLEVASQRPLPSEYPGLGKAGVEAMRLVVVSLQGFLAKGGRDYEKDSKALALALFALGDDEETLAAIEALRKAPGTSRLASELGLLVVGAEAKARRAEVVRKEKEACAWGPWACAADSYARFDKGEGVRVAELEMVWRGGEALLAGAGRGTVEALRAATTAAARAGDWVESGECGEFLYQADPSPRRVSLARYIQRRAPDAFDFFVHDEAHEGQEGTASEHAAHRIQSIGMPTIAMTGSLMNGYAASLFPNMWAASPFFREEFKRSEVTAFVERYGYRKRVVEERDAATKQVVEYGAHSDRVTRTERVVGEAPGVLPLFLLRHLLPVAVTLQKADLAIDLPPCSTSLVEVEPDGDVRRAYERLKERLAARIKKDRWDPERAGKLFGQLSELPSYLDRATKDVGNDEGGAFSVRYPESLGDELVATEPGKEATRLLPKERWLVGKLREELAEGRRAMVFVWHLELIPRLARVLEEHLGERPAVLYAARVPPKKRQEWIEREVVAKRARVLVTNPVAIQTGLNNLVYFSTEVWFENPACNPIVYRQAGGRVDRVGQKIPTRIYVATYANTIQKEARDLLLRKVNVSLSTDGLDPDSALASVGVGESEFFAGMSLGRMLWKMMAEEGG